MENKKLDVPWNSDTLRKGQSKSIKLKIPIQEDYSSFSNRNLPDAPDLPCIVCYTQLADGVYTDCLHRVICLRCAQNHFNAAMQNSQQPKCLVTNCKAPFLESSYSLFYQFNQKTREKWHIEQKKDKMRKNSVSLEALRSCQYPNCEGFINPQKRICIVCCRKHCSDCFRLDHNGHCKSTSFIQDDITIKQCRFCKGKIYKQGGCSRLVCPTCRRPVCYECGQVWSVRHHGCANGGWFRLPWYFLVEHCCGDDSVNRHDERMI